MKIRPRKHSNNRHLPNKRHLPSRTTRFWSIVAHAVHNVTTHNEEKTTTTTTAKYTSYIQEPATGEQRRTEKPFTSSYSLAMYRLQRILFLFDGQSCRTYRKKNEQQLQRLCECVCVCPSDGGLHMLMQF